MIPKITNTERLHIVTISLLLIASVIIFLGYNETKKREKYYESIVGRAIIIGKDTLTVTNYNKGKETYDLSNRVIVDRDYVTIHAK